MSLFDELNRRDVHPHGRSLPARRVADRAGREHGFVLAHNGLVRRPIEMSAPDDTPNT